MGTPDGPLNPFQPVSMMTSLVMPDPEIGAVGQIHIPVEYWNALEQMNVLPSLMSNNSMKLAKNLTLFTVYPEAVKVRQIFEAYVTYRWHRGLSLIRKYTNYGTINDCRCLSL